MLPIHPKSLDNLKKNRKSPTEFEDKGAMWRDNYESLDFIRKMDGLWEQVRPLYDELHRYVMKKLQEKYGSNIDVSDGLLPAHVLGNMWAQEWGNIFEYVKPYPKARKIDIDGALKQQNYTALRMFQVADDFFQSLGLEANTMSYDVTKGALIEKPKDGREVLCHASAWDFCNGHDFRLELI